MQKVSKRPRLFGAASASVNTPSASEVFRAAFASSVVMVEYVDRLRATN